MERVYAFGEASWEFCVNDKVEIGGMAYGFWFVVMRIVAQVYYTIECKATKSYCKC